MRKKKRVRREGFTVLNIYVNLRTAPYKSIQTLTVRSITFVNGLNDYISTINIKLIVVAGYGSFWLYVNSCDLIQVVAFSI